MALDALNGNQTLSSTGFKFVDLFSGLGGFHLALGRLGGECVFACEKDDQLRDLYLRNFGLMPESDIRDVSPDEVPSHDVLCAGFPCQSFSKAGAQLGLDCFTNGDLIHKVLSIAKARTPKFLLLENVANLEKHANGSTWKTIRSELEKMGYSVDSRVLSPHQFGIPQVRERMFIVASRIGLDTFSWPEKSVEKPSIRTILERRPKEARSLSPELDRCLAVWQEFLSKFPADKELPSFPIWSMEFGADYPFEDGPPAQLSIRQLKKFRGSHGTSLNAATKDEILMQLPSYARSSEDFPQWKKTFIRQNRCLYELNKVWLDKWKSAVLEFPPSFQKFEWNCKGEERSLWSHIIQIRASGIRVKRDCSAPALVAMTTTQIPIIGWERRYLTPRECARLQSFPDEIELPLNPTNSYKALGNALNQELAFKIATILLAEANSASAIVINSPELQREEFGNVVAYRA